MTNVFTLRGKGGGGQSFYVRDGCGDDPVDGVEEEDVSKVSKLSAGARIFRSP